MHRKREPGIESAIVYGENNEILAKTNFKAKLGASIGDSIPSSTPSMAGAKSNGISGKAGNKYEFCI